VIELSKAFDEEDFDKFDRKRVPKVMDLLCLVDAQLCMSGPDLFGDETSSMCRAHAGGSLWRPCELPLTANQLRESFDDT
jgi:hypothetical protein